MLGLLAESSLVSSMVVFNEEAQNPANTIANEMHLQASDVLIEVQADGLLEAQLNGGIDDDTGGKTSKNACARFHKITDDEIKKSIIFESVSLNTKKQTWSYNIWCAWRTATIKRAKCDLTCDVPPKLIDMNNDDTSLS